MVQIMKDIFMLSLSLDNDKIRFALKEDKSINNMKNYFN